MKELSKPDPAVEARLTDFDNRVIAHPILDVVSTNLRAAIHRPAGSSIIANIGPTGGGKSTLAKRVYRDLLRESMPIMEANPGHIPVVYVEAACPDSGSFHWGDFYTRFLEAASEPMVEKKSLESFDEEVREGRKKPGTFAALRRAVEHCIRYRATKVVIIDEAQHLAKVPNARRLQDQLDTIKSLASLAGVLFVMVGTYDLMTLLSQNGQLARRTRRIHFPRYNFERSEDRHAFRNILTMFESRLPIPGSGVLVTQLEFMYQGCLGCVGTLKDWLRRALGHAVDTGREALTIDDLEATILGADDLQTILQEIREGEARFSSASVRFDELRTQFGATPAHGPEMQAGAGAQRNAVGQRKLSRDPVGVVA
jgi:hypothetical protein